MKFLDALIQDDRFRQVKNSLPNPELSKLYDVPLGSTRSGALFNAHAYPTKISPESIALLIACHTNPGDMVFDGFGGSGTTGLAALLCSAPPDWLRAKAQEMGLRPVWGPRRAVIYELSGLGSFIGQTLCERPLPSDFIGAAERVLAKCEERCGWMYEVDDGRGGRGSIRHTIWSDQLVCPSCDGPDVHPSDASVFKPSTFLVRPTLS